MKSILVVLDGMADRPIASLGGKTPLEAAKTPALDMLALKGVTGRLDVLDGEAPESDSAVISILGYDPKKYYTGRGPMEAVGLGIKIKEGTLALRCNFATAKNPVEIIDRRVGRNLSEKEAKLLAAALNKKIKLLDATAKLIPSVAHRAVLIIKAKKKLSASITNTDPAYSVEKGGIPHALATFSMEEQLSAPLDKSAIHSASLLNEFTRQAFEILDKHPVNNKRRAKRFLPANMILSRDAGDRLPPFYNISKKYKRKFAILADMPLEIGIGTLAGMGVVMIPRNRRGYGFLVQKTLSALKKYDSLYIHIKGPDIFGHEGDFKGKTDCIAQIDREFFAPLIKKINMSKTIIAVTADHATPCEMKGHGPDPVPFLISGGNIKADSVKSFSERKCAAGKIGQIKSTKFMPLIIRNC